MIANIHAGFLAKFIIFLISLYWGTVYLIEKSDVNPDRCHPLLDSPDTQEREQGLLPFTFYIVLKHQNVRDTMLHSQHQTITISAFILFFTHENGILWN